MRLAGPTLLALLLLSPLALGQEKAEEENKTSNDRPDRPLQMPPASSEVKGAFDDFERFRRRGAWERALKALYGIPEDQARRFVDGKDGFIVPVARKRRELLAELPPEGQAAYRLFYDDEARKLLDQADGPTERATLERLVSAYFPTTIGDDAADRLGDLYFEMGRFDRAADCWLAVLRDRTDTDLSPALLSVKAALALARAGRRSEIAALRRDVADRYSGETVSLGGQSAPALETFDRVVASESASSDAPSTSPAGPSLGEATPAAWQIRFGESIVAGMTPPERHQWDTNPLSGAVPPVAVDGDRLYANFLGHVFAVDLKTGKLLWRSASFHNIEIPAQQDQARFLSPSRFAILASGPYVWSLGRDLKEPNQMAPFRLTCRRTDGGDVVWQSTDLPDYAQLDLVGRPILARETLYVVAKTPMQMQQQPPHQYVVAIRPQDGKLLWKTEVGMFRNAQRYFYYGMTDNNPPPRLYHHGAALYVDTHVGVLARLDADSGDLEWGYGYLTQPVQGESFFFYRGMPQEATSESSTPLRSGDALYVKGAKSERIYALDPDRMKRLWDRPISTSARLLGADDRTVYLGGPELSALDLKTKTLRWSTHLPGGSAEGNVVVGRNGLWQLTPRGIFEVDPEDGRVRRIFRGDDMGSDGGDLYLAGRLLLAVTNRTISAYPIADRPAAAGAEGGGPAGELTRASHD